MLLLKILSLLGFDRWVNSAFSHAQELTAEGASAIEARVNLAAQEWEEEKVRLRQLAFWGAVCFCLLLCILVLFSFTIIVTYWDTNHRILVCWGVLAFWVLCLAFGMMRILSLQYKGKNAFKYTKQELGEDWKLLKNRV